MIEPVLKDDAFLADLAAVGRRAGIVDLWWLGQSGFLLHHRERWVLNDPYLSDSLTTKYASTDKPHVRMTGPVIDSIRFAAALAAQQLTVTSSHTHTDHLDPDTLRPLVTSGKVSTFIVPRSAEQLAFERSLAASSPTKVSVESFDAGETRDVVGLTVTAIEAAHPTVERDSQGRCKYLGYVLEFRPYWLSPSRSLYPAEKEWTIYHSGDTVVYDGMVERLRPFNVDLAILPINGKVGNMSGRDAARLAKDIGAKLVVPCHYEMFEFNTADPRDEFIPECERLGQPCKVLRAGERLTLQR